MPAVSNIGASVFASRNIISQSKNMTRVRPGDRSWPSPKKWQRLAKTVNGNLIKIESPLEACKTSLGRAGCEEVFKNLKNPYYLGDTPALTQTSGYLNAWQSRPSVYAVAAKSTADVVAAVNFARVNNLRLVVKGAATVTRVHPMPQILCLYGQGE